MAVAWWPVTESGPDTSGSPAETVFEAMRLRRMHRVFTSEPPGADVLNRLVYAASRAQVARRVSGILSSSPTRGWYGRCGMPVQVS